MSKFAIWVLTRVIIFLGKVLLKLSTGKHPLISTYLGNRFDPIKPSIEQVDVIDIAHGLANQGRFNGQTKTYYSIAQHSLMVADIVYALTGDLRLTYAALHHDDTEAYLGDVVKPLKALLPIYAYLEDQVNEIIAQALNIDFSDYQCIKQADLIALATERRDLMPNTQEDWSYLDGVVPRAGVIVPMDADSAQDEFLHKHYALLEAMENASQGNQVPAYRYSFA